jgi:hypothetical protein
MIAGAMPKTLTHRGTAEAFAGTAICPDKTGIYSPRLQGKQDLSLRSMETLSDCAPLITFWSTEWLF